MTSSAFLATAATPTVAHVTFASWLPTIAMIVGIVALGSLLMVVFHRRERQLKMLAAQIASDLEEARALRQQLDAYLKRVFGNQKIRVVPRPKKDDSAEVYIGEEFIGVLFVDDEDDDRSYQFQMAILETDIEEDD